jgi:hypothetical protein
VIKLSQVVLVVSVDPIFLLALALRWRVSASVLFPCLHESKFFRICEGLGSLYRSAKISSHLRAHELVTVVRGVTVVAVVMATVVSGDSGDSDDSEDSGNSGDSSDASGDW